MAVITKQFKADPHLVLIYMRNQAGTLAKAALEGVMNSIDAGATLIEILLSSDRMEITDDGKGMKQQAHADNEAMLQTMAANC